MTRALPLALPLLILAGCDNFRESVTTEPWKSAVITEPPAPSFAGNETAIATTTVTAGSGAEVRTGDLVHLRYTRTITGRDGTEAANHAEDVWLWTGREPDAGMELWGSFGSPELRTTLIGRRVGEVFELRVSTRGHEIESPRYAIAGPASPRKGHNQFVGQYAGMDELTLAAGDFAREQPSWSSIEILAACPARFATRHGRMTQWGYVFSTPSYAPQTDRSGDLRWSAIEARCPGGDVRFMLGPIYWTAAPVVPGMLIAWESTYRSARPKKSFPDDYAFVTINGRTLPTQP